MKSQAITPLVAAIALVSTAICWRGIWGFADLYLVPENQPLSYLLSLLLGVCGFLMLGLLKSRQS